MKNVNITPLPAIDGIFAAYSKTWRRSSGGDYLLKTLQVESHRVQKVQIIRCIRMASWSTRCDGIGHFTRAA